MSNTPLCLFYHDVMSANKHKFRVCHPVFFAIGCSNYGRSCPSQVLANQFAIHMDLFAGKWSPVKLLSSVASRSFRLIRHHLWLLSEYRIGHVHRNRQPAQSETGQPGPAERFMKKNYRDQELERRSDVLEKAHG